MNAQHGLGQSENWIYCVSLAMCTCNVWRRYVHSAQAKNGYSRTNNNAIKLPWINILVGA